ncbi:hypothetical protein BCEP27_70164 [Burkholderia cepacia]
MQGSDLDFSVMECFYDGLGPRRT